MPVRTLRRGISNDGYTVDWWWVDHLLRDFGRCSAADIDAREAACACITSKS